MFLTSLYLQLKTLWEVITFAPKKYIKKYSQKYAKEYIDESITIRTIYVSESDEESSGGSYAL